MTSVLFTLLGLSGLGVSWRWDQTGLWICMPVFWGSAVHDLSCVLRWKSWGLWTANDTWRSPSRILVTPPLGFPTMSLALDWMPEWRGLPKQTSETEGGRLEFSLREWEKQGGGSGEGVRSPRPEALTEKSYFIWMKWNHPLMWKEFH